MVTCTVYTVNIVELSCLACSTIPFLVPLSLFIIFFPVHSLTLILYVWFCLLLCVIHSLSHFTYFQHLHRNWNDFWSNDNEAPTRWHDNGGLLSVSSSLTVAVAASAAAVNTWGDWIFFVDSLCIFFSSHLCSTCFRYAHHFNLSIIIILLGGLISNGNVFGPSSKSI